MLIQPRRGLLQLAADLVFGEDIEYAGLDSAVLAHCRLWREKVGLDPATQSLPDTVEPACAKAPIPQTIQSLSVCGWKLASRPKSACREQANPQRRPAAFKIRSVISCGCEMSDRWLALTSIVSAPMRLAMKRWRSGLIVRSSVETA